MAFYKNKESRYGNDRETEQNISENISKVTTDRQPYAYILNYRIPEGWLNFAIIALAIINLYTLSKK